MVFMRKTFVLLFVVLNLMIVALPQVQATGSLFEQCLQTPNGPGCQAGLPAAHYQMLMDEMLLNPEPNVRPLPTNEIEVARFAFRRLTNPGGTTIFNAPGGAPIGTVAPGFNYVTVQGSQDGYLQIDPGQWVLESDTAVARPSTFSGVLLDRESMEYPMAWVLIPSFPASYPGAEGDQSRPRLERYTRVNIFETVEVDGWRWYLIGPESWIKQTSVAKILFIDKPAEIKGRWAAVDLYEQVLVAYDEETPVFATLISSGLPQWATNEGTFQTWTRIANGSMSGAEGQADFYSLQNVPWTLYFDGSISLHGTYWHDGFGYRHSHGCVNMTLTDSYWFFQWTMDGGIEKPWVHVWASGEYVE